MNKLVLIAGGSGSGKTTIAGILKDIFPVDSTLCISQDNYYFDKSFLNAKERVEYNFDTPDAIDENKMVGDIKLLLENKPIKMPIYDFKKCAREDSIVVHPASVIILEGLFALHYKPLLLMADYKIFIKTDDNIRLSRRVKRDSKYRGYPEESVIDIYNKIVKPMHDKYVEKTSENADLIIDGQSPLDEIKKTLGSLTDIIK